MESHRGVVKMKTNHAKQQNEQRKAQRLFSEWRKDEILYKEDQEDQHSKGQRH